MDVHPNVTVSSGFSDPWDFAPDSSNKDDGSDDYSTLEWLSIYVEDCLSSGTTNYFPDPQPQPNPKPESAPVNPDPVPGSITSDPNPKKFKKRRGLSIFSEEPPLVHPNRTEWLADSEPVYPLTHQLKPNTQTSPPKKKVRALGNNKPNQEEREKGQRKCTHCLSNKTPQWREGPMGPKTLCNACGVRFKSGRLLPEYRPAKSPTFVSWMHSNSHKKVLEMRKTNLPSSSD